MGVLVYRPVLDPHLVRGVPDYWPRRVRAEVGVMMMAVAAVAAVDAVLPVDDQDEVEGEGEDDDPYDPPGYLGHALDPPNKPPLEDLGVLGVSLVPWVKRTYNDVYG